MEHPRGTRHEPESSSLVGYIVIIIGAAVVALAAYHFRIFGLAATLH